jgi:hypothetical protein
MIQLVVTQPGRSPHTVVIDGVTNVGRGPGNDLMLMDPMISWNHAVLWVEGNQLWVRDLGSTNGTWIQDRRVTTATVLEPGDRIRFGVAVEVVVERPLATPDVNPWMVEDLGSGVRIPLRDGFVIGASPKADIVVPGEKAIAAVLRVTDGVVWIEGEGQRHPVGVGELLVVQDRPIVLRKLGSSAHTPTDLEESSRKPPYRLTLDVDGPTGPRASVTDLNTRIEAQLDGNRAVMLYVLGRRRSEDLTRGRKESDAGWCSNDEVQTGIWGKSGDSNKLHVLLYRLRGELRELGFDPLFIEKQQGYVRIRVAEVIVR